MQKVYSTEFEHGLGNGGSGENWDSGVYHKDHLCRHSLGSRIAEVLISFETFRKLVCHDFPVASVDQSMSA